MILKASQRSGGQDLAAQLMRTDGNEHVSLHELCGFASHTLKDAFKEVIRSVTIRAAAYSNLIEVRDTHPTDIERALKEDCSADAKKRDLQLEAKAHIAVQKWIDGGGQAGRALSTDGVRIPDSASFCLRHALG